MIRRRIKRKRPTNQGFLEKYFRLMIWNHTNLAFEICIVQCCLQQNRLDTASSTKDIETHGTNNHTEHKVYDTFRYDSEPITDSGSNNVS